MQGTWTMYEDGKGSTHSKIFIGEEAFLASQPCISLLSIFLIHLHAVIVKLVSCHELEARELLPNTPEDHSIESASVCGRPRSRSAVSNVAPGLLA